METGPPFHLIRNPPAQIPPQQMHLQSPSPNLLPLHVGQKPLRLGNEILRLGRHQIAPGPFQMLLDEPFQIADRHRSVRRPGELVESGFGFGEVGFEGEVDVELGVEVGGAQGLESGGLEALEEGEERRGGFHGAGACCRGGHGRGGGGGEEEDEEEKEEERKARVRVLVRDYHVFGRKSRVRGEMGLRGFVIVIIVVRTVV